MSWFKNYITRKKEQMTATYNNSVKEDSEDIFQVCEYMGKLWFVYDENLVCPCDMIKGDALEALSVMRSYYIDRNSKK